MASAPAQSDIVITPDGRVHISFFWSELEPLRAALRGTAPNPSAQPPAVPAVSAPAGTTAALDVPIDEYRACTLCPRACGFDRTARVHPLCGDATLRVSTWGLTLGDEEPIRGTRGSGAVMLGGCPLTCPSCHNPEMVRGGRPTSPAELADIAWELARQGAHNLQILSPTVHLPALRVVLGELKRARYPLPVVWKSSGYESVEELRKLAGLVDIYLPDLKYGPRSAWARQAGAPDYFEVARAALSEMSSQAGPLRLDNDGVAVRGVLVRHVQAPLPDEERDRVRALLRSLPPGVVASEMDTFVRLE